MKNLIIDGNNLLHRVFWIAKSKDQVGENNYFHIYLFINCIKKYTEKYQPNKIFCCWDEKPEKLKNVRYTLNPAYKANRNKETAVEVYSFNEQIKSLVESLGIKNLFPLQYEADDIMCYLTRNLPGSKAIITVDKDIFQLVGPNVVVFDPIRKVEVNTNNFNTVTNASIENFIKIKALKGDKSDNIDGLKGFGEKTIEKYLNNEITLTEQEELQFTNNLKIMDLSQGGVTDEKEIVYIVNQLKHHPDPNYENFIKLCEEFNFTKILQTKDKWNELFFFKNQYTSLLEGLFA